MDTKNTVCIVAVTLCAIMLSATAVMVMNGSEGHEPDKYTYTLFFGTDVTGDSEAKDVQADIIELLGKNYKTGYTSYFATGSSFIPESGIYVPDEYSIVLVIGNVPSDGTIEKFAEAALNIEHTNNVFIQKVKGEYKLLLSE